MQRQLTRHPYNTSPVARIEVDAMRSASGLLRLTYSVAGALMNVAVPHAQPSIRTDELWRHTCFEVFIAATHGYYEFNLSPSTRWAAYRFDGYREGMRDAPLPDPQIRWTLQDDAARLTAALHLPPDAVGPLGLSAVIEDEQGGKSYWALAHPPGKPDFHDAACFTTELPPAG